MSPATAAGAGPAIVADPAQFVYRREPLAWKLQLLVLVVGLLIFLIGLTGYPNLSGNEHRVAAYAMDALHNGHWFVQRDFTGEIAAKPPLLTWLVVLGTLATHGLSEFALYWPSAAGMIGTALVLLAWGRREFGWEAGILAAFCYLCSPAGQAQMLVARYDGLLALPVVLGAWAAIEAWRARRNWTLFWLAAAVGTLVKGPLALVLSAAGMLAVIWERRTGHPSPVRGKHGAGILLYLGICGGWFWLAYLEAGPALIDKMLARELVGHVTGSTSHETMLAGFYQPPLNLLVQFAPWSVFTVYALWRTWRRPSPEAEARRLERFLAVGIIVGLLVFSVAAHQGGRLIVPLLPAAALLAGRELAQLVATRHTYRLVGAMAGLAFGLGFLQHHVWWSHNSHVQATLGMRALAMEVRHTLGDQVPLTHVNTPFALQYYLKTASPYASVTHAAELLAGDFPAYVAIERNDFAALTNQFPAVTNLFEVARWPKTGAPSVRILGNERAKRTTNRLATVREPFLIQTDNLQWLDATDHRFTFRRATGPAHLVVQNQSACDQKVSLRVLSATSAAATDVRTLKPGEAWALSFDDRLTVSQ